MRRLGHRTIISLWQHGRSYNRANTVHLHTQSRAPTVCLTFPPSDSWASVVKPDLCKEQFCLMSENLLAAISTENKLDFVQTSHSSLSMSSSSWLIWEPQWLSGSTLTPEPRNKIWAQQQKQDGSSVLCLNFRVTLQCTCGEHARVGVGRRETHVLLDAAAGALGHPLDGQVLGRLQCPLPCAALVMDSLHRTVQGRLQGLKLGGGLPQEEACHKLTQHWRTLILL